MTDLTQLPDVREQRPLGYWLKHIDGAIEESMGRLFAADGLNRRGWQVLNTSRTPRAPSPNSTRPWPRSCPPTNRPCARTSTDSSSAAGHTRLTMTRWH